MITLAHCVLLDLASVAKWLIAPGERERSILTQTITHAVPQTRPFNREEVTRGPSILPHLISLVISPAMQITATLIEIMDGVLSRIHIMLKLLIPHRSSPESGPIVDACL
jgi:hypothetical protein